MKDCAPKKAYPSRDAAEDAIDEVDAQLREEYGYGTDLTGSFECAHCGAWHLRSRLNDHAGVPGEFHPHTPMEAR